MKAPPSRPLFAVGLLVCLLAACQSELPTSPDDNSQSIAATATGDPDFLLGGLLGGGGGAKPTLIKVRAGQTLTARDARLSFLKRALSFPTKITQQVDGNRYVSFRFGPNGLAFDPVAILSISVDKADLRGVDPQRLRIAVASDDREDWRVVGGIYNPLTRTVVAPVLHFSRYALCVE
jgi:hypothetical protein